jgi:BirA family biotin operon repressor/biotin-[acetyl-CoA-carboxylase] ligase
VDELVPERILYGQEFDGEALGIEGHILALLAPVLSQFDALVEWARAFSPQNVYCIAGAGTAMRGHHGRSWSASLGNLHLSAVHVPERSGDRAAEALVALPSVAVCDVIREATQIADFGIKWVNDVLIDGAKVAGVLAHTSWRGSDVLALVYGVGLNVEVTPGIAEDPAVPSAISLCDREPGLRLEDLTLRMIRALSSRIRQWSQSGGGAIVDAYRSDCVVIGRDVEILKDHRPLKGGEASLSREVLRRGKVRRLDDQLRLHLDDGDPTPVSAGRLRLLPQTISEIFDEPS